MVMRTALILGIGSLIVACGNAPSEDAQSGQAAQTVATPNSDPSCSGWVCGSTGTRPVGDAELFALLRKFEPAGDATVTVASLECAQITGGCSAPSCTLKTMCGGGGPLSGDDVAVADGWLQTRHVPQEIASFASRRLVVDIACERQPVTGGVACTFRGNPGGPTH
jgi:hypothetical protein